MSNPANRIVGTNVRVEFLPTGVTEATSVWSLDISGSPTSGSFALVLNGEVTGAIAHDANAAAIEAALEALNGVAAADIAVSGTSPTFTVTAANDLASQYNTLAVTGVTFDAGSIATSEDTTGTGTIVLTGDYTAFSFNRQIDTADVTAGNEQDRYEKGTIRSMEWNMTILEAIQPYESLIKEGTEGVMTIFKNGKATGYPYIQFNTIIKGFSEDMPFDDVLEIELTGSRQGAMIADFGSTWS